eukprot:28793-Amphidinium_carterae.1
MRDCAGDKHVPLPKICKCYRARTRATQRTCCQADGMAFEFAAEELRSERDFVLQVVQRISA